MTDTENISTAIGDPAGTPQERTLAQRIEEGYADAWRPAAGDSIIGYVQEINAGTTDYGTYPIMTLVLPGGARASVHAFHSILQGQFIDAQPGIGEEVAIKYMGLRVPKAWEGKKVPAEGSKDDPRYHDYRLIVNRAPADIWSQFSKPKGREA